MPKKKSETPKDRLKYLLTSYKTYMKQCVEDRLSYENKAKQLVTEGKIASALSVSELAKVCAGRICALEGIIDDLQVLEEMKWK